MAFQMSRDDGLYFRQTLFDKAKRVVVKVGSAVLTDGAGINLEVVDNLCRQLSFLHNTGREVILVSSGAVAAGKKRLSLPDGATVGLKEKQALAAIGQSRLMQIYDKTFSQYDKKIGQILLTHSDLSNRDRYLNVRNTIFTLFKFGVIPIVNENDTVSVEELRFGDNDTLGAYIANLIEADMFICLTDVVGLYSSNPKTDPTARPIYTVTEITPEVEAMVSNVKSALGTGGMLSKLKAAKMIAAGGGSSFIGPGREKNILELLFSGEMIGTFFLPKKERINSRKQWIANVLRPKGTLVIDKGAELAMKKHGRSLLPVGVVEVIGSFGVGDSVQIVNEKKERIAVGLVNYSSGDLVKIKGVVSEAIESKLGFKDSDEIIHRDNCVF